ncbi:MAG: DUF4112 domain-containing protein [Bacteroidales bacterium]|nr:DUF4112 domain-containing protein [Bacteroidales bacterium]
MIKGYLGNVCYNGNILKNHIVRIDSNGYVADITPFKSECEGIVLSDDMLVIVNCKIEEIEKVSLELQKEFEKCKSYNEFINSEGYKKHITNLTKGATIVKIEIKEEKPYYTEITNKKSCKVENSKSYKLVCTLANLMDKYYIDPIIGFIPIAGDIIPPLCSIPSIYVSAIKLRSIPLTLAITLNILIDALVGMIPFFIGNIIDFYNKAYIKNLKLIIGYVNNDKETINKVNKKAIISLVLIFTITILLIAAIVYISKFIAFVWEYFKELFA